MAMSLHASVPVRRVADRLLDSNRASTFQRYSQRAREIGAVNLAQGIPEALADSEINSALSASLGAGWQYTDPWGLAELREAVAEIYQDNFLASRVLITSGCTESLYVGLRGIGAEYGTQIGFFEPFYPYYIGVAHLLAFTPVAIPMRWEQDCAAPDWPALEDAMRGGVRVFILNTPHNPTGWVLDVYEARRFLALADKYGVFLVVDEAYKYFVYDNVPDSATRILYQGTQACLVAGAATKLLSASGLRIGWLLGESAALHGAQAAHMYTTYCQPAPLQRAAAALLGRQRFMLPLEVMERYAMKRDMLVDALRRIGLRCGTPGGGHFVLADYSDLSPQHSSAQFAEAFALKYGVMPLPADPFYRNEDECRQVRFSFSPALEVIRQAASRLHYPCEPCPSARRQAGGQRID